MDAHQLPDVTVGADAGMISDANMKAIEEAGLSFILAMKIPMSPYPGQRNATIKSSPCGAIRSEERDRTARTPRRKRPGRWRG
jgi:hypothetical protein